VLRARKSHSQKNRKMVNLNNLKEKLPIKPLNECLHKEMKMLLLSNLRIILQGPLTFRLKENNI